MIIIMMMESLDTTINYENQGDSYVSFYEYPHRQSSINPRFQVEIVALPTSNRDELIDSLESLALKIKTLENQRKVCENLLLTAGLLILTFLSAG